MRTLKLALSHAHCNGQLPETGMPVTVKEWSTRNTEPYQCIIEVINLIKKYLLLIVNHKKCIKHVQREVFNVTPFNPRALCYFC